MHCAFTGHFSAAQVAIKKVLQDKRFKNRELQIMKMMGHPNVVDLQHCFFTQEKNEVRAPVTRRLFLALPCLRSRILATPAACCFTDAAASQLAPAAMQLCSREVNRKACSCHKTLYYKKKINRRFLLFDRIFKIWSNSKQILLFCLRLFMTAGCTGGRHRTREPRPASCAGVFSNPMLQFLQTCLISGTHAPPHQPACANFTASKPRNPFWELTDLLGFRACT